MVCQETVPTDTDVGVMPVWSLKADGGMVDLVDDTLAVGDALVDEQAASDAATTTALRTAAIGAVRRDDVRSSVVQRIRCLPLCQANCHSPVLLPSPAVLAGTTLENVRSPRSGAAVPPVHGLDP